MASCAVSTVLLLALTGSPCHQAGPAGSVVAAQSGRTPTTAVRLFDLATVRRSVPALVRQRASVTDGERVAAWAELSQLIEAVAGVSPAAPFTLDELERAAAGGSRSSPLVSVTQGVDTRDRVAYQMLAVGYSAREAADVVTGRISLHALDTARRMVAVGYARETAADYLDAEYARAAAMRVAREAGSARRPRPTLVGRPGASWPAASRSFDALIDRYARVHGVEAAIVRAIIEAESAFDPAARSHAGAIGLMQLMPVTARELGVDPFVPEQNIEGGVRYLSRLLERFGTVDLALVAYNAGPGFAERYARGQIVLYGETRDYVSKVMARLQHLR